MRAFIPHRQQQGFTLIELVVVVVLIAIVAAYARARYSSLSTDANTNATSSIGAALAAASAENYAKGSAGATHTAITNCTGVGALLPGGLPSGYTITSLTIATATTSVCTVSQTGGVNPTTFTGVGISP